MVTPMEADSRDEPGLVSPAFFSGTQRHAPANAETEKRLEILVIYTEAPGTLAALRMAEGLTQKLDAYIRLIVTYEVPYTLPLTQPAVPVQFLEDQIRQLARKTKLDVAAEIYLCREKKRALESLLEPHSLVVVGGRKRWWRTADERLARVIRRHGHDLIFAELR